MTMWNNNIHVDGFRTGHVQGIAVDRNGDFYISFTTVLVKADRNGNIIGSVTGLAGHLGCIAYQKEDGRVYGSLEYKHDIIGRNILAKMDQPIDIEDAFYIAIFDVEKITRMDMDAEQDGIMKAVHLKEVLADYQAPGHRFGCSGIDGVTFAPLPGETGGRQDLYVAYGIYGDETRQDNDHQILLRYDVSQWEDYAKPINQRKMHRSGPDLPDGKYRVFTGNTCYGIQNLEYDAENNCLFAAVYRGTKPQYPNYSMFVINLSQNSEILPLAQIGLRHDATGIRGYHFPYGATGMIALGDGLFYFSRDFQNEYGFGTDICLYRFTKESGFEEMEF